MIIPFAACSHNIRERCTNCLYSVQHVHKRNASTYTICIPYPTALMSIVSFVILQSPYLIFFLSIHSAFCRELDAAVACGN